MDSLQTAEAATRRPSNFGPRIHRESEVDASVRSESGRILPLPVGGRTPWRGRWTNRAQSTPRTMRARSLQAVAENPALALGISFAIGIVAGRVLLRR